MAGSGICFTQTTMFMYMTPEGSGTGVLVRPDVPAPRVATTGTDSCRKVKVPSKGVAGTAFLSHPLHRLVAEHFPRSETHIQRGRFLMCLQANPALGFDPPDRVPVGGPGDAVTWARVAIPDFGWYPEVYVLFLAGDGHAGPEGSGRALRRAAWLGSATTLDDFVAWPDFSLGYTPPGGADAVMLVICRPGEGVEPTPD